MVAYSLWRIAGFAPTLLLIVTIVFFMMRLAPGGPFDTEATLSASVRANLEAAYGLDQPILNQYLNYLGAVTRGDLGPSFTSRDYRVSDLLARGLPISLAIGTAGLVVGTLCGLLLGAYGALRRGAWVDHAVQAFSIAATVIPLFVLAPLLALLVGVELRWLPAGGWEPGDPTYLVLPSLTLALPIAAAVARLSRSSALAALGSDYVRTAVAKGLSERRLLTAHVLKPALAPVVGYLGPVAAATITGSVVVEHVFGLPGMGRFLVHGAVNRDYTLVLGAVIVLSIAILICNLIADLVYAAIDPQVRFK